MKRQKIRHTHRTTNSWAGQGREQRGQGQRTAEERREEKGVADEWTATQHSGTGLQLQRRESRGMGFQSLTFLIAAMEGGRGGVRGGSVRRETTPSKWVFYSYNKSAAASSTVEGWWMSLGVWGSLEASTSRRRCVTSAQHRVGVVVAVGGGCERKWEMGERTQRNPDDPSTSPSTLSVQLTS